MTQPLSPLSIASPDEQCALHKVHHPTVALTYPVFEFLPQLQVELFGEVIDPSVLMFVCATGLDNLMLCVDYMLGRGPSPQVRIGADTWEVARGLVTRYES